MLKNHTGFVQIIIFLCCRFDLEEVVKAPEVVLENINKSVGESGCNKSETKKESEYKPIGTYLQELDDIGNISKGVITVNEQNETLKSDTKLKTVKGVTKKKLSSKERKGWTEAKEDLLGKVWEQESLLYDRQHENYSNSAEREAAEERIAMIIEIDGK